MSGVSRLGEPIRNHRIDQEGQAILSDRIAYLHARPSLDVRHLPAACVFVNPASVRGLSLRMRPGGESITFIRTTIGMSTST